MTINIISENGKITLSISGWLHVETTLQLHEYMETLESSEDLVFDFRELEYISSAGVREVVASYRRQKETGGTFCVINVNPDVLDVFHMTGLDRKIDIQGVSE